MIKKGQSISSVAKKFSVNSDNEESYTKGKAKKINVTLWKEDKWLNLVIKDNGIGC